MTAYNVNQAILQVRDLREKLIESRRFKGYSGAARALSGTLALLTAAIMASPQYPKDIVAFGNAWAVLFAVAVVINYGSLLKWFFADPDARRDIRRLIPAFDAFPPLLVGCALTIAMGLRMDCRYLYGVWMCCYGLINLSQADVLPKSIRVLGLYYISCGIVCLVLVNVSFMNPWPMGIVFFIGEWWGGIIFHLNRIPNANVFDIFRVEKWS